MSATLKGYYDWSLQRDDEGYRTYTLKSLVQSAYGDDPLTVLGASGLPAIGSYWPSDPWAFCLPRCDVQYLGERKGGERFRWWLVTNTFTNKPQNRCQDASIDDPLDEPPKISGSFARYQKPTDKDRNGKAILSSSHEKITGLEKEANRPQVVIEFNDSSLDLPTFTEMVNGVNDSTLWGVDAYGIMLTDATWSRQLYGTCNYYFTKRFTFDVKFEGWAETDIADMGFKVYDGKDSYGGAKTNPKNFILYKDPKGDKHPKSIMLKDGEINEDPIGDPQFLDPVEHYFEYNFLTLGIPSSLE